MRGRVCMCARSVCAMDGCKLVRRAMASNEFRVTAVGWREKEKNTPEIEKVFVIKSLMIRAKPLETDTTNRSVRYRECNILSARSFLSQNFFFLLFFSLFRNPSFSRSVCGARSVRASCTSLRHGGKFSSANRFLWYKFLEVFSVSKRTTVWPEDPRGLSKIVSLNIFFSLCPNSGFFFLFLLRNTKKSEDYVDFSLCRKSVQIWITHNNSCPN